MASRAGRLSSQVENRGECAEETCAITPECAAAAWLAAETNSAGPQETIPPAATSGQKPRLPGLDADASVHSLFPSERRGDRCRGSSHERAGPQGDRAEDVGFLGDPALLWASPGKSGFVPSARRAGIFAQTWDRLERTRASIAESIPAARHVRILRFSSWVKVGVLWSGLPLPGGCGS